MIVEDLFKNQEASRRITYLHPITLFIMMSMWEYCSFKDLRFVVTDALSTFDEDFKLGRISKTHLTGRAFDLSIRDWSEFEITEFIKHFSHKFRYFSAISKKTNAAKLILRHKGTADHLHVQIHSRYANRIDVMDKDSDLTE